jgi:hypothetical protein
LPNGGKVAHSGHPDWHVEGRWDFKVGRREGGKGEGGNTQFLTVHFKLVSTERYADAGFSLKTLNRCLVRLPGRLLFGFAKHLIGEKRLECFAGRGNNLIIKKNKINNQKMFRQQGF